MSYNRGKKYVKNNPKAGYELKFNGSKMYEGDLPIMFQLISKLMLLHVSMNPSIDEYSTDGDIFRALLSPLKTAFAIRGYTDEELRNFFNAYFELARNSPDTLISILKGEGSAIYPNGKMEFFN